MINNIKEKLLIKKCLQKNADACRKLYSLYASKMYGVCLRFVRNSMEADDILQEGFIKVFENLKEYKYEGSFEGWIRKTMVNTAINHLKRSLVYSLDVDMENLSNPEIIENEAISKLSQEELVNIVQELPDGKRVIFNLYAYEGYNHREIADILNITISTSKTQLAKAKKMLQEKLEKIKYPIYERID